MGAAMMVFLAVLVVGFVYEWKKGGKAKQPYFIHRTDDKPFAFAGLWETWRDKTTGQKLRTYTILTTDPNELMEPIHNRMPVILHRRDYERWMAPADPARGIAGPRQRPAGREKRSRDLS
jgi:putative SOS response-associated peptidase YedK